MSEFTRSDYLRIKWSFVAMAISVLVGVGLFAVLRSFDMKATTALRTARTENEEAQQRVDKISQEEETIRANIGKYQIIHDSGLVGEVDLLQMKEHFAVLRGQYNLFPISLDISPQSNLLVPYGALDNKRVDKPGRPISLQMSNITIKLPLLHENDLANLLNGLAAVPELLQVHSCSLTARSRNDKFQLRLSQNLDAECKLGWYSFHIDNAKVDQEQGGRL